ncbi:MAG TPA: His/Gly/Thr/Pro-type tRNA ligase C-terminal domain-containing protein, partial [Polyangiaceae bacterium]|nr:His/Gly/Thr/Pro-type tRNA ligase C-terminal domain-containing protein [Polyangiaceae bacterium]
VHVVQMSESEAVTQAVARIERELQVLGIDCLIDDRDERPGVKFKDADLIGIPLRVTVGEKALAAGNVEFKPRSERDPKKIEHIPLDQIATFLHNKVQEGSKS